MSGRQRTHILLSVAGSLTLAVLVLGCGDSPSRPGTLLPLEVVRVTPSTGPAAASLTIAGTGFRAGATVTIGGVAAKVDTFSASAIVLRAPAHPPGPADVIVSNPGGESATLAGGYIYVPLTITSFDSPVGFPGLHLFLTGTGFLPGAVVTFDGVRAETGVIHVSTLVLVTTPAHDVGTVDIVITNPGGERATLAGGFTYVTPPVLSVTPTSVAPRGRLDVTWGATTTWGLDWIGLFRVGAPNTSWIHFVYTGGAQGGTSTFTAPAEPGQYEFRYLPNDSYGDVARAGPVTVTATAAGGGFP